MTNLLHLFSDNEDIDEVSTTSLKYLLLPGLLNYFTLRKTGEDRLELVKKAKAHVKDFMRLCALYNLTTIKFEDDDDEDAEMKNGKEVSTTLSAKKEPDLLGMANQRQNKIDRYKEQKKTLQEIKELRVYVEKEHVDDEVQRKYYLLLLKNWISSSLDDYENIKMELQILKQMAAMKAKGIDVAEEKKSEEAAAKKKPFRPFIITKDQLQKQVIGAGYPSLPTMTVEEFYEQKVKDGTFQIPTGASLQDWARDPDQTTKDKAEEEAIEEEKIAQDDPEKLAKMRNWDDWKDDVRRGDGNRMNMG